MCSGVIDVLPELVGLCNKAVGFGPPDVQRAGARVGRLPPFGACIAIATSSDEASALNRLM
jgi:hypothetical protein